MLLREVALCAGQAVVDRNLAGVRGRFRGYRAAAQPQRYPESLDLGEAPGALETLRRRLRRRSRLRAGPRACGAAVARRLSPRRYQRPVAVAGGGARLARGEGSLEVVIPGSGNLGEVLGERAVVQPLDYEALTKPDPGFRGSGARGRGAWSATCAPSGG